MTLCYHLVLRLAPGSSCLDWNDDTVVEAATTVDTVEDTAAKVVMEVEDTEVGPLVLRIQNCLELRLFTKYLIIVGFIS